MPDTLCAQARLFRSLHDPARPLVLANAWDVASAVLVADAGASAVATTSAGVAWSLGTPDGDRLDRDRALAVVARIAAAVDVPVTADVEGGLADSAAEVEVTVRGVLDAGAVGINLEDGERDAAETAARVAAARRAADRAGVPLFVNARTDVYLRGIGPEEGRLDEAVARAARYVDAGADGIFVPGTHDLAVIAELAERIGVPVNVLVGAGAPSVADLAARGVARVSLGSSVALAAYAAARRAARELFGSGTYDSVAGGLGYGDLDGLLARAARAGAEASTGVGTSVGASTDVA
ncbi:MAG TPA: isocitrate lyase/phosphoenolpyruvate mutase family protein [Cellulomonas sp.]